MTQSMDCIGSHATGPAPGLSVQSSRAPCSPSTSAEQPRGRTRERRTVHFAGDADRFEGSSLSLSRSHRPSSSTGPALWADWQSARERVTGQLQALDAVCAALKSPQERDAMRSVCDRVNLSELDAFAQGAVQQIEAAHKQTRQSRKLLRGIAEETAELRPQLRLPPSQAFNTASVGSLAAEVRSFVSDLSLSYCDVPPLTPDVDTSDEEWVWLQSLSLQQTHTESLPTAIEAR